MLGFQPLDLLPIWGVALFTLVVLYLANEGGYRLGGSLQKRWPDRSEAGVGVMVAASLAFLGFLVAFSTGIAVDIFSSRMRLVVMEANAIGTTYLRAGYLDEPYSSESRQLLREYVDMRLAALDSAQRDDALARSEEIQMELWQRAQIVAGRSLLPAVALYVSSLNEVIDLHTERLHVSLGIRLPPTLLLSLYAVAALSMVLMGIHGSYTGKRNFIALATLTLILGISLLLVVDLDRSQQGFIRVPQQALLDLQRMMSAQP